MKENRKEDVTRRVLFFLLILVILVSIVGTYGVIETVKEIRSVQSQNVILKPYGTDRPTTGATVAIEILPPKKDGEKK